MKVYIATDWDGTKIYISKPEYIDNGTGEKEWFGLHVEKFKLLLPNDFKQKKGECIEAEIELKLLK